jgi:hypothetical protein
MLDGVVYVTTMPLILDSSMVELAGWLTLRDMNWIFDDNALVLTLSKRRHTLVGLAARHSEISNIPYFDYFMQCVHSFRDWCVWIESVTCKMNVNGESF